MVCSWCHTPNLTVFTAFSLACLPLCIKIFRILHLYSLQGHDAQELINEMQHLFAVDIDLPVGSSVRSALLNHSGHYVAVVDIHRLSDSRYPYVLCYSFI